MGKSERGRQNSVRSDLFIETPTPLRILFCFSAARGLESGQACNWRPLSNRPRELSSQPAPLKNKKEIIDGTRFYKQVIPNGIAVLQNSYEPSAGISATGIQRPLRCLHSTENSEEPKETRDQHLLWASSSGIKLYRGTNMVGQILFSADEFWLKNCLYRDDTAVFQGMQSKLRTATPITNARAPLRSLRPLAAHSETIHPLEHLTSDSSTSK